MKAFSVLMFSMAVGACAAPALTVQAAEAKPSSAPEYEAAARPVRPGEWPEGHALITGTVSYGAQTPPPIGAELDLSLEDVSRADAPADVISVASVVSTTSPPSRFDVTYDPSVLIANHRYVLRARIVVDGVVLFVSDKAYPVLGAANTTHVDIVMRRATPEENTAPDPSTQLENTYWKLVSLGDEKVVAREGVREAHFVMQSEGLRVHGFAGCNGMIGSYTLKGTRLTFSHMGGTLMACSEGMELEQKFHLMFPRVATWKLEGELLELLDGAGTVLATFEPRHMN